MSVCSYGMQLENMLGDIQADENDLGHCVNLLVLDILDTATRWRRRRPLHQAYV
ncbi:hypothetical protein AGR3A_pa70015 [Agrobacterium tomkonis CFBP 6623]|uniref:Uncharacterized protein n=1 Tax=Agrobacterium tomkonis CFBP 6623 TaxID=1183432 RepID=A0A1S7S9J6_9HYPH|nr:hypothetical protein AGR3A_pa70015 [Agrobacterium tomkonis CFBP 6623]